MTREEFRAAIDALPPRGDLLDPTITEKDNSMKTFSKLSLAAAVIATLGACSTLAQESDSKVLRPYPVTSNICQRGQAMTYVVACDPGSRADHEVIFPEHAPGVAVCRVQSFNCQVFAPNPNARAGFEVRDTTNAGELISITFGLDSLLGEAPAQRGRP